MTDADRDDLLYCMGRALVMLIQVERFKDPVFRRIMDKPNSTYNQLSDVLSKIEAAKLIGDLPHE